MVPSHLQLLLSLCWIKIRLKMCLWLCSDVTGRSHDLESVDAAHLVLDVFLSFLPAIVLFIPFTSSRSILQSHSTSRGWFEQLVPCMDCMTFGNQRQNKLQWVSKSTCEQEVGSISRSLIERERGEREKWKEEEGREEVQYEPVTKNFNSVRTFSSRKYATDMKLG